AGSLDKLAPCFLDFEASSLSDKSYPIEVAWNFEDGSIESHLISPAEVSEWTDWSQESERIHGISRTELLSSGESPVAIGSRISEFLPGRALYSDAPDFDGGWMSVLFSATVVRMPRLEIRHCDMLFLELLSPALHDRAFAVARLKVVKEAARKRRP